MTPNLISGAKFGKTPVSHQLAFFALLTTVLFFLTGCNGKNAAPATLPAGTSVDITETARTYIDYLSKSEFEAATGFFDGQMKSAAPVDTLEQLWNQLTNQLGAFQQMLETNTGQVSGYQAVYVTCQFEKGKIDIRVVFNSDGQISGMQFVPAGSALPTSQAYSLPGYATPDSFREVEVTIGSGEWALPGTLTIPNGSGLFPGVVLVHGSGPNDRDETINSNKPFRDLALGLATQGIAVLRYDKRTYAHKDLFTPDIVARMTVKEETVDDALLAVQLLRKSESIDPKRVFVLGHSLGATLAPRIGRQDPSLAGLIIMAGLTRSLEDTILDQVIYLDNLTSKPTHQQQEDLLVLQTQVAKVKDPALSESLPATQLPLNIPASYWLDLRGYQPAEVARTLGMPLLVLQGGLDYQVSPTKDFERWKSALVGKTNVTFRLYPDLNHLFMTGFGTPSPSDYIHFSHVNQSVVKDIASWIKQN